MIYKKSRQGIDNKERKGESKELKETEGRQRQ